MTGSRFLPATVALATLAALAIPGTARPVAAQVPRIAPPPPCRFPASTDPLLSVRAPADAGRRAVVVFPFTQGVIERRLAHVPYTIAAGIRERLRVVGGLHVPTVGQTARATFESGGAADSAMRVLGVAWAVRGEVEPAGPETRLRIRLETLSGKVAASGTWYLPRHAPVGIEDAVVRGVLAALIPKGAIPAVRDRLAHPGRDLELLGIQDLMSAHRVADADSARRALEALFVRDTAAVVAMQLALATARALERGAVPVPEVEGALRRVEALASYAMARDSSAAGAWTARAVAARVHDPRGFAGAEDAHRRATAARRRAAGDEEEFGVTLLLGGRAREARERFARALALEPGRPSTLAYLAEVEHRLGNPVGVCAFANASIAADPFNPRPYVVRALARLGLAQAREAYADAETALQLEPSLAIRALRLSVEVGAGNRAAATAMAREFVREALSRPRDLGVDDAVSLARGLLGAGMRREAITALTRAQPRGVALRSALAGREFAAIRGDSAIVQLLNPRPEAPAKGS